MLLQGGGYLQLMSIDFPKTKQLQTDLQANEPALQGPGVSAGEQSTNLHKTSEQNFLTCPTGFWFFAHLPLELLFHVDPIAEPRV